MEDKTNMSKVRRTEFDRLYPQMNSEEIGSRLSSVVEGFKRVFGRERPRLFSAPGRTELGGNHTDHQNGLVIAAAVALDNVAAALPNGEKQIRIFSDTHGSASVDLCELSPVPSELGSPSALVRGVAEYFAKQGYSSSVGFDCYISGMIPVGSGLSSSAAFEVLIAAVMNGLCFDGRLSLEQLARAGQYAENTHFGKPCGLMDQMSSAYGGIIEIDFEDPNSPRLEQLSVNFADLGYALCIVDTGSKHDNLGEEYAAIPLEMTSIAEILGYKKLRELPPESFYAALPKLHTRVSDRALLRTMHFFGENERVAAELDALKRGDFESFLKLVRESGQSSWRLLQNIYPSFSVSEQPAALALAWCERLLGGKGACRIHGGGFGGTIQAYVPVDASMSFKENMELLTGLDSCRFLSIRDAGAVEIEV